MEVLEQVKERPISFTSEMVKAVLEGRKTQTRRVIKLPSWSTGEWDDFEVDGLGKPNVICVDTGCFGYIQCPYGNSGDHLWIQESYRIDELNEDGGVSGIYLADNEPFINVRLSADELDKWLVRKHPYRSTPGRFMYKSLSRIKALNKRVRVERIQDISGTDAFWEGCNVYNPSEDRLDHIGQHPSYTFGEFRQLWDSINESRGFGWDKNPYVWVVEFERIKPV